MVVQKSFTDALGLEVRPTHGRVSHCRCQELRLVSYRPPARQWFGCYRNPQWQSVNEWSLRGCSMGPAMVADPLGMSLSGMVFFMMRIHPITAQYYSR